MDRIAKLGLIAFFISLGLQAATTKTPEATSTFELFYHQGETTRYSIHIEKGELYFNNFKLTTLDLMRNQRRLAQAMTLDPTKSLEACSSGHYVHRVQSDTVKGVETGCIGDSRSHTLVKLHKSVIEDLIK